MHITGQWATLIACLITASPTAAQELPALNGSFLSREAPAAFSLNTDASDMGLAPQASEIADTALAEVNDPATGQLARKSGLYKSLMELNGTSRNVRTILTNTKAAVKLVIIERNGGVALTAAQEAKFDRIADPILTDTENNIIDQIALAQSQTFSESEIRALITANSGLAAAKYNDGKFTNPEAQGAAIQGYMVDAVVKIVKSFHASISG